MVKSPVKIHNITQEQFDALKKQAIEEGCAILREYNTDIKESARIHFSEQEKLSALRWEDLWKEAIKQKHLSGLSVTPSAVHTAKILSTIMKYCSRRKTLSPDLNPMFASGGDSNWIKDLLPTPAIGHRK